MHWEKIKKEDIEKMIELRQEGKTYQAIGRVFSIHHTTVMYHLKCHRPDLTEIKVIRKIRKNFTKQSIPRHNDPKPSFFNMGGLGAGGFKVVITHSPQKECACGRKFVVTRGRKQKQCVRCLSGYVW